MPLIVMDELEGMEHKGLSVRGAIREQMREHVCQGGMREHSLP
jgi:hypothetical protein